MRRALLAASVLVALAAAPRPLRADEPPAPPPAPGPASEPLVGDLTSEEIAALRQRFPRWDVLERAARERIARNVRIWRGMTPPEREKVLERARRLERAGPAAREEFARRLDRLRGLPSDDVRRAREGGLLVRASALAVRRALPDAARRAVDALPEGERGDLEACVSSLWRQAAIDAIAARPPESLALSTDAPERLRQRFGQAVAAAAADPDARGPRRALAAIVFTDRWQSRLRAAGAATDGLRGRDRRAVVEGLAQALSDQEPEAFRSVVDAVTRAAEAGPSGLATLCQGHRGARRPASRERAFLDLVRSLEARREALAAAGGGLVAHADALERGLLVALEVPADEVDAVSAARTKAERDAALRRALRRFP